MKLTNGLTNFKKIVAMGTLAVVGASSNVMAAEDAWVTALNTKLAEVQATVGAIVAAVVAIYLVPLAWGFVKRVLARG